MSTLLIFLLLALFHFLLFPCYSAKSVSLSLSFSSSEQAKVWLVKPSSGPSSAPAPSPSYQGPDVIPRQKHPRHHRHHHSVEPYAVAPSPSESQACGQICTDPLTATPIGSPCGCVFPMKIRLILDAAPLSVFPVINELEMEVALGTYMKQSQVRIMGVSADIQNQGRTLVDINLVPLGDKFDKTTAILTYERFWHKKVPLNRSLFGDYTVSYTNYPGMPTLPPHGTSARSGSDPDESAAGILPFTANFTSRDMTSKDEKMNPRTIITIALSSVVLLLVLIGAIFIILKWRKVRRPSSGVRPAFASSRNRRSAKESVLSSRLTSSRTVSLGSTKATSALSVKTFSLPEIEKATDQFSSHRVIGEGGFGRVYRGTLDDGTDVAVKLLTRDIQSGDREFTAEVEMLCRLHHRNLVKLIGICIEGHRRCLVYELIRNGSVESHLHGVDKRISPLDWEARKKIALGAARGLAYLHEDSNPRVIHRDFKASNVLLEEDFTPKVSDFGLAKEATEGSRFTTRVMGTFGYVDPEYAMTGHLLVKSDVYSYGVVLLELLTGKKPVDMSQPLGEENLVTWSRPLLKSREGLEQLVDPSLAGSYDFDDMAKVAGIAYMCVQGELTRRPFMGEVVQALKLIFNDKDETSVDCGSRKESSAKESDGSWWNGEGVTCELPYGQVQPTSFFTMEYSSGPLEEVENLPFSPSSLMGVGDEPSLPIRLGNRSGPLRTARQSKLSFYRLTGNRSDHAAVPSKRAWNDVSWP